MDNGDFILRYHYRSQHLFCRGFHNMATVEQHTSLCQWYRANTCYYPLYLEPLQTHTRISSFTSNSVRLIKPLNHSWAAYIRSPNSHIWAKRKHFLDLQRPHIYSIFFSILYGHTCFHSHHHISRKTKKI